MYPSMWASIGTFLGGLGLFLLSMSMITDGLKLAAGGALRSILARFTQTPARGVASGALMTGIVQSSSAVTVATIGFVNAGLLTTVQALGVVLGATIGTTMTGWLVSLVGFQFSISVFALPLIGAGMLLRLVGPSRRAGAIGEAIAGFGLFFVGVDLLRGAFEGAAGLLDIAALSPTGITGVLLFAAIGVIMTVITQSSSAAIAVVLTAATGGLIGLPSAAALVVGATVGTTSTALLAVIGATSNARRVAVANVAIHLFSGTVGLALLPGLLWLVLPADPAAPLPLPPALALAAFHTTFAILGVLLMWPLTGRMARLLERRFKTPAEALGRPVYLDSNVMFAPAVALDAFVLELKRMSELARTVVRRGIILSREGSEYDGERAALRALVETVEHFVVALERDRVPNAVGVQLPLVLRISNYIDEAVALIDEISVDPGPLRAVLAAPVGARVRAFLAELTEVLDGSDATAAEFAPAVLEAQYHDLYARWRALKSQLLQAGVDREVPLSQLNPAIEALRSRLRAVERCTRVAIRLSELGAAVSHLDGAADPAGESPADADAEAVAPEQPATAAASLAGEGDNGTRERMRGP